MTAEEELEWPRGEVERLQAELATARQEIGRLEQRIAELEQIVESTPQGLVGLYRGHEVKEMKRALSLAIGASAAALARR